MSRGLDISEHDNGRHGGRLGPDFFAGYDFVIVRAANENGLDDRWVRENIEDVLAAGKPLGIYCWPLAGRGVAPNRTHGALIASAYSDPRPPLGFWADREVVGGVIADVDEVEGLCAGFEQVEQGAGHYSNDGECARSDYLDARPWWMSDYGPNDGAYHDPNEQPPVPARDYQLHQFTSVGDSGNPLDVNDCADLAALIARMGGTVPPPTPEDDMKLTRVIVDGDLRQWITDGITRRWIQSPDELQTLIDLSMVGELQHVTPEFLANLVDVDDDTAIRAIVDSELTGRTFDVDPIPPTWSAGARNLANVLRQKTRLGKRPN